MTRKRLSNLSTICLLAMLLSWVYMPNATQAASNVIIPSISILNVVADQTVTLRTHNFPANDTFDVLMGKMGTRGVGGIKVATIHSGAGGSFDFTVAIPVALMGRYQIAVRVQSTRPHGFYAYNWFYNRTTGDPMYVDGHILSGTPRIFIKSVERNQTVTITTLNFPKNDSFNVLMGRMGTKGIGGILVTSVSSAGGGILEFTFPIPAALHGLSKIAIRLQSNTGSGYYAYNWFFNTTSSTDAADPPALAYFGYPTMQITHVIRDQEVTFTTSRLPPNDHFVVLLGPMGTRGINGIQVAEFDSLNGDPLTLTVPIPPSLHGSARISIRFQSSLGSGYYAYNWFYNTTTH